MPVKIMVADGSWLMRRGLAQAVERLSAGSTIVEASDPADLDRHLAANRGVNFVFVEDAMLGDREAEMFDQIRRLAPEAAIGVLVGRTDRERVLKAIYFGATAILPKTADEETTLGTLRAFFDGQAAVPRVLLEGDRPSTRPRPQDRRDAAHTGLTPREREVIAHVATGKTVARIATELGLSPHTVRVHVTRIMKKLDLRDRSALIHYAVSRGSGTKPVETPSRQTPLA